MSDLPPLPEPIALEGSYGDLITGKVVSRIVHETNKFVLVFTDGTYLVVMGGVIWVDHDFCDSLVTTAYVPDHEELWNWDLISLGTYLAHKAAVEANEAAESAEGQRKHDLLELARLKQRFGLEELQRIISNLQ